MSKLLFLLGFSLFFASCQLSEQQYMSTSTVLRLNQCTQTSTKIMHEVIQAKLVDLTVADSYRRSYQPILAKATIIEKSTKIVYDSISVFYQEMASLPFGIPIKKERLARFQALKKSANRLQKQSLRLIYNSWNDGGIKGSIFADSTKRKRNIQSIEAALSPIILRAKDKQLSISTNSILLTTLGMLQQKVKQNEAIFINFLRAQTSEMRTYCSWLYLASNSSKTCIRLGETYETAITFLQEMPHDNYEVRLGNRTIKMIDGRSAVYNIPYKKKGEQHFWTSLMIKDPLTKEQTSLHKPFYFEVTP
jgi:hypothetical protein